MVKTSNLQEKEQWVMKKILVFYSDEFALDKFLEVINGVKKEKKISLRLIDWFVTNFSKKHNISYPITRPNGTVEYFSPYQRYRDQLSSYPKKLFDPFCRGNLFKFKIARGEREESVETAICQLHFFKWAIENLLLEYVEQHAEEIYKDMQLNGSRINPDPIKKTKQQLSKSIYHKIVCTESKMTIPSFS